MATEKRLIDANALIDWLTRHTGFRGNCEDCTDIDCLDCIIENAVKNAPTVDAVEVVRCKDCKHWHEETGWCDHHSHFIDSDGEACHPWESSQWKMFDADDFCSYGERRTDNG